MKQSQKLDTLISKILAEELDEKKLTVYTPDGSDRTMTSDQRNDVKNASMHGTSVEFIKKGQLSEKEIEEQPMRQTITGAEVAGQVAEILNSLSELSKSGKDDKHKKLAAKAMKQLESAKAALEALTGHETMLEEKDQAEQQKAAQGHLKAIEKHLGKIVKDKDAVGKMMKKMPIEKVIAMKQQMQDKEKGLDEEKLARVMLKHSLKEGWVKKN